MRIQGGLLGLSPPLWTSEISDSGGFHAPIGAKLPLERKKFKPPPGQIHEHAPE